jgi:DMSO/TMAO reductase YedYZ molybdopterin-dependent catalytic subunit
LPPGEHLVDDFPVLCAGPTPYTPVDQASLMISGAVDRPVSWAWEQLLALPAQTPTVDIHCVTKWSKLETMSTGVSVDPLLAEGRHKCEVRERLLRRPLYDELADRDMTGGRAWIVDEFGGEPLHPEHGGPCATAGSAPVLLEECQVGARTGAP